MLQQQAKSSEYAVVKKTLTSSSEKHNSVGDNMKIKGKRRGGQAQRLKQLPPALVLAVAAPYS